MVSNSLSRRRRTLKRPIVCKSKQILPCPAGHVTVVPPTPSYVLPDSLVIKYKVLLDDNDSAYTLALIVTSSNGGHQPLPPAVTNHEFTIVIGGNEFREPTDVLLIANIVGTVCIYDLTLNLPPFLP